MAIYRPTSRFFWKYAFALVLGNAFGWFVITATPGAAIIVSLLSLASLFFVVRIWFPLWSIELTTHSLVGPTAGTLFRRCTIPLEKIDRTRSIARSSTAKMYGYWDIWSLGHARIRIYSSLIGRQGCAEILSTLGLSSIDPKHRLSLLGRFLQIVFWLLLGYVLFHLYMQEGRPYLSGTFLRFYLAGVWQTASTL
jgi:hypothetical protein